MRYYNKYSAYYLVFHLVIYLGKSITFGTVCLYKKQQTYVKRRCVLGSSLGYENIFF